MLNEQELEQVTGGEEYVGAYVVRCPKCGGFILVAESEKLPDKYWEYYCPVCNPK